MAITITIGDLRVRRACRLDERVADLTTYLGRVPTEDEPIPAEVWWALPSTSTSNAVWSLRVAEPAEEVHRTAVRVAVVAARKIEHLLPAEGRDICKAAIAAAEEWLKEPTGERAEAAASASRAADAYATNTAAYVTDAYTYAVCTVCVACAACVAYGCVIYAYSCAINAYTCATATTNDDNTATPIDAAIRAALLMREETP